ncbi:DNA/RNA helicase, superfamily II [Sphaerochaeta pleomorpha str. Grapes]|uniref:DNA/RNA helicase, superfamily II n=1 Tax=Sphaerochaeta pleomorpha (strain ATCC BAA-1885 / DSM 22778 / Grapes) TaxID=158190 RepID=G8QQP9_SPHPG|nr:DEAD/DEAH box helicase [Sphaerochaeta pleomorpha]AEV28680.1 DNA/RNA helicase, superfamily II [Sphaerochaeta pleomorpha str. Grapes]
METNQVRKQLPQNLHSGFIDASVPSSGNYGPHLVLNDPPRTKVLATLLQELDQCTSFVFSVAFITSGGLAMIFQSLCDAQKRGVKGKILTSDYLNFTDPKAIRDLWKKFPNIEVRVYSGKPFHTKGYLFYHGEEEYASMVIGSSNLTQEALATNREWNVRLVSLQQGDLLVKTQEEFNNAWSLSVPVSEAWLTHYEKLYKNVHVHTPYVPVFADDFLPGEEADINGITPNSMQSEALKSLASLRAKGKTKALLISATGTGKTFLCAFDVKAYRPGRFLYIVHREQIASESMKSFKQIVGTDASYGFLGGGESERDCHYVFSMIQTLSKDEVLHSFPPGWFDYIVVDEVHRSGGQSYQKVLDYFKPKFLLGMTATPERTDGFDIYALFDNTIAYEIRLNQALEADLLCPFHYFGISDLTIEGKPFEDFSTFSRLEMDEWVKRVQQTIDRYSIGLKRRRGLIFCSRNDDAVILSEKLNILGFRTLALSGKDDIESRNDAFRRLEIEDGPESLEYLIAVDIFNEGIDIPSLNQVILLRPTESAIIFVQQIGRGLRKCKGKEFLTIIDIIGNYTNNYMIPIALYGDSSYKKDSLRKVMGSGSLPLSGVSTVSFDRIAKERIYHAINGASFSSLKFLKEEYCKVRAKLGVVPSLVDFVRLDSISPLLFIENCKNYAVFKMKVESDWKPQLSTLHVQSLTFFSKVICPGLRPYESIVISLFLKGNSEITLALITQEVEKNYGFKPNTAKLLSALSVLGNGFFQEATRNGFGQIAYCSVSGECVRPTETFLNLLHDNDYKKELEDILLLGDYEYLHSNPVNRDSNDLVPYNKYTRQDVCRLLGWEKDESSTIYGYKLHYPTMTCPIFVTYDKDSESIDPGIDYQDKFISPSEFAWETRNQVHLDSKEPKAIRGEDPAGPFKSLLFVKKSDDEGTAFYYLGEMDFLSNFETIKHNKKGQTLSVVAMRFAMKQRVSDALYDYLCDGSISPSPQIAEFCS